MLSAKDSQPWWEDAKGFFVEGEKPLEEAGPPDLTLPIHRRLFLSLFIPLLSYAFHSSRTFPLPLRVYCPAPPPFSHLTLLLPPPAQVSVCVCVWLRVTYKQRQSFPFNSRLFHDSFEMLRDSLSSLGQTISKNDNNKTPNLVNINEINGRIHEGRRMAGRGRWMEPLWDAVKKHWKDGGGGWWRVMDGRGSLSSRVGRFFIGPPVIIYSFDSNDRFLSLLTK